MARTPEARILLTAKDATKAAFRSVDSNLSGMESKVASVTKVLAGLTAGFSVAAFVSNTAEAARGLENLSARIGASTEALQAYQYVAEQTGVSFQTLTTAWQRQNRRIAEAVQGYGTAKDALNELGLAAEDLIELRPEQAFELIADALVEVETTADQSRLAMALWDTEGVALLQTLRDGGDEMRRFKDEAYDLGLVMSDDVVESMSDLNEEMIKAKATLRGLANDVLSILVPAFNKAVSSYTNFIDALVKSNIKSEIESVGNLGNAYEYLTEKQESAFSTGGGFGGEVETVTAAIDRQTESVKRNAEAVTEVRDQWDDVLDIFIADEKRIDRIWAEQQAGIIRETEKATEEVKDQAEEIPEIYKDAARTINAAFTDTFRAILDSSDDWMDTLKNSLISGFKDLIAQMLTLAAKPIVLNIVTGIGGALGVPGDAMAGLLPQLGGGAAGAGLGSFGLPIALGIGALGLGALLTDVFKGSPDEQTVGFSTGGPFDSDISATINTAFGEVGFAEGSNNLKGASLDLLKSVQTFDDAIARYLSPEDIDRVSDALQGTGLILERVTFEAEDLAQILEERAVRAFEALGLPIDKLRESGDSLEDIGNAVEEIIRANDAIEGFIESADPKTLTQAEQSVEGLNNQVQELIRIAESFGFGRETISQIETAGDDILSRWVDDFNRMVEGQLLEIDDPMEAARRTITDAFDAWRDDLVASAEALGADMEKVWALIDAKAAQRDADIADLEKTASTLEPISSSFGSVVASVIESLDGMYAPLLAANEEFEEFRYEINEFIRSLQTSALSPLSPLAQLEAAQEAFYSAPSVEAAQEYLDIAQRVYAGTESYKEIFQAVQDVLQGEVLDRQAAIEARNEAFQANAIDSLEGIRQSNILIYRALVSIIQDRYDLDVAA